jgi:uncharacterized protein (TIGR02284 family)
MAEQDKWVSVLEDLVETCRDGEEGYRQAADHAEDPELRAFFNDQYQERGAFAQELENRISHLGKHGSKPRASTAGALNRAWIGLKQALGGEDGAILGSVEQGERAAIDHYQKALQQKLPEDIEQTLHSQLESLMAAQDFVKLARQRKRVA